MRMATAEWLERGKGERKKPRKPASATQSGTYQLLRNEKSDIIIVDVNRERMVDSSTSTQKSATKKLLC